MDGPPKKTVEELEEELRKVQQERDQLKGQVAELKGSAYSSWPLHVRTPIKKILRCTDPLSLAGGTYAVAGWIRTVRFAAKDSLAFVKLNDGSCFDELQVVVENTCRGWSTIKDHTAGLGASVYIVGNIIKSQGKGQLVELSANEFRLLGTSDNQKFPLSKKEHSLEFLRTQGHLRPRTQLISSIARVRNALAHGTHLFFQNMGFYYIHTPIITASDCEGAGEMFQVTTLFPKDDAAAGIPTLNGQIDYSKDFFKKKSFLTVSGQLNGELYATAMGSIYTFGPTFRAEDSNTGRHLAEFWMIEPEIAFADLFENMDIAEQYVKFVLGYALEQYPEEFKFLEEFEKKQIAELKAGPKITEEEKAKKKAEAEAKKNMTPEQKAAAAEAAKQAGLAKKAAAEAAKAKAAEAPAGEAAAPAAEKPAAPAKAASDKKPAGDAPEKAANKKIHVKQLRDFKTVPLIQRIRSVLETRFARVTYTEAVELLLASNVQFDVEPYWGLDLGSEHERWLAEQHFKCPTICYNYPKDFKAFYMRLNEDNKTVAAMDILVPGMGELIGGSQREERLDVLLDRLKEKKLPEEPYSFYLDTRKYGTVVHSGFGLGFERLVCFATGIDNIKESIPFPRFSGHADF